MLLGCCFFEKQIKIELIAGHRGNSFTDYTGIRLKLLLNMKNRFKNTTLSLQLMNTGENANHQWGLVLKPWWDNSETGVDRCVQDSWPTKAVWHGDFCGCCCFSLKKRWLDGGSLWHVMRAELRRQRGTASIHSLLAGPLPFSMEDRTEMACSAHAPMTRLRRHASGESMPALAIQGPPHIETARTASQ